MWSTVVTVRKVETAAEKNPRILGWILLIAVSRGDSDLLRKQSREDLPDGLASTAGERQQVTTTSNSLVPYDNRLRHLLNFYLLESGLQHPSPCAVSAVAW